MITLKKILISYLLLVLFLTPVNVSAHPTGTTCLGGSELLGYLVKCDSPSK